MKTIKEISNDLANSYKWDKKINMFCPVLTHGLSSNVKVYENELFSTKKAAEERAKEMIDEGYPASNNMPARDYCTQRIEITANGHDFREFSAYNIYL